VNISDILFNKHHFYCNSAPLPLERVREALVNSSAEEAKANGEGKPKGRMRRKPRSQRVSGNEWTNA